jgi:hypothetical protein
VVTALKSLSSFPALVSFLQAHLPSQSLPDVIADAAYAPLLESCLIEWPTIIAKITPLPLTGSSVWPTRFNHKLPQSSLPLLLKQAVLASNWQALYGPE